MNLESAPRKNDLHYKIRSITCYSNIISVDFIDSNREDANGDSLRTNVRCDPYGYVSLPASSAGKATGIGIIPVQDS